MTTRDAFDRLLSDWLDEAARTGAPGYLDETLDAIGGLPQRAGWRFPGRWLPVPELRLRLPLAIPILAVLGLLIVAALALLLAGGGRPRVPTQLPPPVGLAKPGLLAFDGDGQIVLAEPDGSRTYLLHPTEPSLVNPTGIPQFGPAFSPDGTRVAFWQRDDWKAVGGGAEHAADLWVVDVDGSNAVNLTPELLVAPWSQSPAGAWAPDGSAIAFTADKDAGLYVVPTDASGPPRLLGTGFLQLFDGSVWSPDGSWIAFTAHERLDDGELGVSKVLVIRPDGTGLEQVSRPERSEGNGFVPQWSPDGRTLLYLVPVPAVAPGDAQGDGPMLARLVAAERGPGGWTDRVIVDVSPIWPATFSNDGSRIAFLRLRADERYDLVTSGTDGTGVQTVTTGIVSASLPCWSPDDRTIAVQDAPVPPDGEPAGFSSDEFFRVVPVDGSTHVTIPAGTVDGHLVCAWQRLAP